eukprot:scaffold104252_cov61-Phaeocystis_antarctica.AAC.2
MPDTGARRQQQHDPGTKKDPLMMRIVLCQMRRRQRQLELLEVHLAVPVRVCLRHQGRNSVRAQLLLVYRLNVRLQVCVAAPAAAVSIEALECVLEPLV